MKLAICIFTLISGFISLSGYAQGSQIRASFHRGKPDKAILVQIITDTTDVSNPIHVAYKGLCETMMAEHALLPTSKLRYFKSGKDKIERSIKAWPKKLELRYIRLMAQLNAPKFLGYSSAIEKDIKLLIEYLPNDSIETNWKIKFISNLEKCKYITEQQITELKLLKQKL